jgi:hypothetical protein
MAAASGVRRNLAEADGSLYINRWLTGQYTNRSPLYVPVSALGIQVISSRDVLWDGLNVELTPQMTLARRYGFSRFCSSAFGSSDWPLAFSSFKNLSGTIKLMVDTPTKVVSFTASAQSTVFSKGTTAQTSFQKVGNTVYMCNGTDAKKWDQTTVSTWGIVAPSTAASISLPGGSLSPKIGFKYVYVFKNSTSGHISTASPVSASTGIQTSKNIGLSGSRSTDAQVDDIDIYRTVDGGSDYFYLATISNPPSGTWSYTDSTADSGLNTDLVAPLAHTNDPPPAGISLVVFHIDRLFVAVDNKVYFAGGPDITNGVPEEAFPPANSFKFPGKVTAMASTTSGLLVFTSTDSFVILGSDTVTFKPKPWQKNFGVQSQNCVVQDGDLIYVYTSTRQLFSISDQIAEAGFVVSDKLMADFNPASAYLALHRNGTDQGLWLSNGSTKMRRYSLATNSWDTEHQVVNGAGAIASVQSTDGSWKLFTGRTSGSGFILARDTTTSQDDGSSYSAFVTVGSFVVAPPGETAQIDAIFLQVMPVGTYPTVSVLLNEISGTFTALPNPVSDPPKVSSSPSTTVTMNRHHFGFATTPLARNQIQHMQVKITFAAENFRNELLGLGAGAVAQ